MLRRNEVILALLWALQIVGCYAFVHPVDQRTNKFLSSSVLGSASTELPDKVVNGETKTDESDKSFEEWICVDEEVENHDLLIPFAPPLSFDKFVTMQEKRVVVTVRYSQGLKAFYLTVAKRIKEAHPDVLMEKLILPALDDGEGPTFEVLVDGKVVLPRGRSRKQDQQGPSVYVSMYELDLAIAKARRKRRPSTVYGDNGAAHMFRRVEDHEDAPPKEWKD